MSCGKRKSNRKGGRVQENTLSRNDSGRLLESSTLRDVVARDKLLEKNSGIRK